MATFQVGSALGTVFNTIMMADDIEPGYDPSYELCKLIYLYHPLGAKIAEKPIELAQSQEREISVPKGPGDRVKERFIETWRKWDANGKIMNVAVQARIYGITSVGMQEEGVDNSKPVDWMSLWKKKISFNVFDPLNTAGSLVLNQDPLAMDFQQVQDIVVNGSRFHKSRSRTLMNEKPIFLRFQSSTFGFTGRSVYQRSLFPLKSFIQTMVTNDMVSVKAGVIVTKQQSAGSIITDIMEFFAAARRNIVKIAKVGNVISMGVDEEAESLDLKNLAEPFMTARKNIIEDIASGTPMPAKMLTEESFAQGFADGTEDAKEQARYVAKVREWMQPLYDFFDKIVMHLAWTPEFYEQIQEEFPKEYGKVEYEAAFYEWANSFSAVWPNLLIEPESERSKSEKVKFEALIEVLNALMPKLSKENLAILVEWVAENMNEMRLLFGSPLELDYEDIASYEPTPINPGDNGLSGQFGDTQNIRSANDAIEHLRRLAKKVERRALEHAK